MGPMSHCSVLQAQPTEPAVVSSPDWLQAQPPVFPTMPQSVPISICIVAILGPFILQLFASFVSFSN